MANDEVDSVEKFSNEGLLFTDVYQSLDETMTTEAQNSATYSSRSGIVTHDDPVLSSTCRTNVMSFIFVILRRPLISYQLKYDTKMFKNALHA